MYIIECLPPINESMTYRFDTEKEATDTAAKIAREHRVQVNVYKAIKRFLIRVELEEVK